MLRKKPSKLDEFIHALQAMNRPNNQELGNTISFLENLKPEVKAKIENNDDELSRYAITIYALHHEMIQKQPQNNKLFLKFLLDLNSPEITKPLHDDIVNILNEMKQPSYRSISRKIP